MSGLLNSYSTVLPRYPYPLKYYMLQELTGNLIEVYSYTNGSNIYAVKNPFPTSSVPDVGVVGIFDSTSNINVPISNVFLNSFTMEYFVNTASTSNVSLGDVTLNIVNNTRINLFYPGLQQNVLIITQPIPRWSHFALSGTSSFMRIFINGIQIYSGQPSSVNHMDSNVLTLSSQSYLADLRISNSALYNVNFSVPKCPLQPTNSTYFLLTGNFDQTRFQRNSIQFDPHNFNSGPGTYVWTGWLPVERVNTLTLNAPTGRMFMAVGSNGTSNQIVNYAVNGFMASSFNSDYSNVYAPIIIYLKDSNGTVCTLNGKNVRLSNIQNAQLSNVFKLSDTNGGVLKNTNPPRFGTSNEPDLLLKPDDYSLQDLTGNYLGYTTTFTLSQTKSDWKFTPTPKLNTYILSTGQLNVSNVSIFLK